MTQESNEKSEEDYDEEDDFDEDDDDENQEEEEWKWVWAKSGIVFWGGVSFAHTILPSHCILIDSYNWRIIVFSHTFLLPMANWVNQKFLVPGLITGYVVAMGSLVIYAAPQYFWSRLGRVFATRASL